MPATQKIENVEGGKWHGGQFYFRVLTHCRSANKRTLLL